ncbi:glycosyltransferase family 39 protein [Crossiella sp. CA198]|uniref:glycosyltransferase family 39 protein n=1 Tax=Crossiella sp. CA198 TaxID=3455607 RepID=UPI003F8D2238
MSRAPVLADTLAPPHIAPWSRRLPALAAALTTLILGAIGLGGAQLWRDELASWSAARRTVGELLAMTANADAFYLPYYLFLHYWMAIFGDSEVALRLPSLLAAAGTAAVVAALAGRWFGTRAGWCAGLLFALVPMVTRMAQEARPYAFVMLFIALSTYLLLRALDEPSWRHWAGYGVALAAVGLTQLTAFAIVAGHVVLVLARWQRPWRFALTALLAVLPAAPLAVLSLSGGQGAVGMIPRPGLLDLFGFTAVAPADSMMWPQLFRSAATAWIVLALALAALLLPQRRRAAGILAVAGAPILVLWAASQAGPSFFFARYLVFLLPVLVVTAGVTLAAARPQAVLVLALAAVAAITVPDQLAARSPGSHDAAFYPYAMFTEGPGQYADYRRLADRLRRDAREGDMIVYANRPDFWFTDTALDYHWRTPDRPRDVFLDRDPIANANLAGTETTAYAARLAGANRVWVIGVGERQDPFAGSPALVAFPARPDKAAAVQAQFALAEVEQTTGFTVALMHRR